MSLGKHLEGCTVDENGCTLRDYRHNEDPNRLGWDLAYSLFFTILDNGGIPMIKSKDQIPDKVTCWYNKYIPADITTNRIEPASACMFYIKYKKEVYSGIYTGLKQQISIDLYHDEYPYHGTDRDEIVNALIEQLPKELEEFL